MLDETLAWREVRVVPTNLTRHYDRTVLLLESTLQTRALVRKQVELVKLGAIVDSKRLGEALAWVKMREEAYPVNQQRGAAGRARLPNNLEALGSPSSQSRGAASSDVSTLQPG